jgi:hypothetical protein
MENIEKYVKIAKRLNELKGVLLLDREGLIYLLKGYTFERDREVKLGSWPFNKIAKKSYISQIELSTKLVDFYEWYEFEAVLNRTNHIIADRKRYLKMLSHLNKLNYTIRKK